MDFLFILHCLSYPLSINYIEKISKEGVDRGVALSTYYVTQTATCQHVFMPTIITINR